MGELQFTTVDRVFASLNRKLKGTNLNETDVIEYIGEALEQLQTPQCQEQAVHFCKVKDFHADIPEHFHTVLQLARNYNWQPKTNIVIPEKEVKEIDKNSCKPVDYSSTPYIDMGWQYINWTNSSHYYNNYRPIRLANHTFFNSLVCKEKQDSPYKNDYKCNEKDEYTIVGLTDKKFRFSFKEGYIALSYLKSAIDKETGYPYVPDNVRYLQAITYYVKWQIADMLDWNGREGYARHADKAERQWQRYCRQAKNWAKMPKSIDEFQDLLQQSHVLIPNHRRYYNYFGNIK